MKAPPKSSWLRASSGSIGIAVKFGGLKISALSLWADAGTLQPLSDGERGRRLRDQQPGLVRWAGAAEVLELEVAVARRG